MRVPTYSSSESIIAQIQKLTSQQTLLQKQVSTNQRIFNPEDDPAAMGRLLGIDTERRQILQYKDNASLATNLAQASYTGLDSLSDLAERAGELAALGGDIASGDANSAYATEVNQLLEQALQVANTRFGGDYLYAGTALDAEPFTVTRDVNGQVTAAAYAGNTNQATVSLSEVASIAPRTSGDTNLGIRDFINQLVTLRDALKANDTAGLATSRTGVEASSDTIINAISDNGAVQLRIQMNTTQQTARLTGLDQLASGDADVDMASALVKLSQTSTSYEAALSSGSKILQMSLLDYI